MKAGRYSAMVGALLAWGVFGGCAGPQRAPAPVRDAELTRLNRTARAAYSEHSLPVAVKLYTEALKRARTFDSPRDIGDAAYNLAACQMELGEYELSEALLREAEAELTRANVKIADVLLLQARLAYWQNRATEAAQLAERLLADPHSQPSDVHKAEVELLKGQLALDASDITTARAALSRALPLSETANEARLRAGCERLWGQIFLREGKAEPAAEAFDREANFLQEARQPREMVRALRRSGSAWDEAGKPAVGADRFFRAARSAWAQHDMAGARESIELCLTLARNSGAKGLIERASDLKKEINQQSTRSK